MMHFIQRFHVGDFFAQFSSIQRKSRHNLRQSHEQRRQIGKKVPEQWHQTHFMCDIAANPSRFV